MARDIDEDLEGEDEAGDAEHEAHGQHAERGPGSGGRRPFARAARSSGLKTEWLSGAVKGARGVIGRGADWVESNPGATLVFVGILGLVWLGTRRKCAPVTQYAVGGGAFQTSGFYSRLASSLGFDYHEISIADLQGYLNHLTNGHLVVDGILGSHTQAAIADFQSHNGIGVTGFPDPETKAAILYLTAATSNNPRVKEMAVALPSDLGRAERPVTYSPYAMPGGSGSGGQFRTGIQSTSMYDVRFAGEDGSYVQRIGYYD